MERRHKPSWNEDGEDDDNSELIANVGPLDVYYEYDYCGNNKHWIIVVGPDSRCRDPENRSFNFDVYGVKGNNLELEEGNFGAAHDVHIELAEMCEIYQLCVERGLIKRA